jgi:hypothetical protein
MSPTLPQAELATFRLEKLDRASVYDYTLFAIDVTRVCSQFNQICVHHIEAFVNPVFDLVSATFSRVQLFKKLVELS